MTPAPILLRLFLVLCLAGGFAPLWAQNAYTAYFDKDSLTKYQYTFVEKTGNNYDFIVRKRNTSQNEAAGDAVSYEEVYLSEATFSPKKGIFELKIYYSEKKDYRWKINEENYLITLFNPKLKKIMYKPSGEKMTQKRLQSPAPQVPTVEFEEEFSPELAFRIAAEFFILKYEKIMKK
ncbi:hypothetical protein [Hugenholtzia roseola]|uniref:hypothetical protein n=1 Tax=Hugenholtzia roseola TaxID=1002 RepID=UPI0012B5855F|nr:hypothetical protein [Hugenholtzia roseola]